MEGSPSTVRIRDIVREKQWWLLAALIAVVFRRPLLHETFFFRDLYLLFYPKRLFLAAALRSGHLPLWDPLAHGGAPFLANPAHGFFYPSTIVTALLPPVAGMNVDIVSHFFLCAFAAYWLARITGLSANAAAAAGAVYALAGTTLSTANLLPLLHAAPWLPITAGLVHRYTVTGRKTLLCAAALAAACPLLAGAAEFTAITFATLLVWALATPARRVSPRAAAGAVFAVAAGAVLLSLALTLPASELVANSSRSAARRYEGFSQWSVAPQRLAEIAIPRFFGRTDALDDADYWGRKREDQGFPYFLSIYFGASALLLAIFAMVRPSEKEVAGAPGVAGVAKDVPRFALAGLALFGIVLSLGAHLPFFRAVYRIPFVAIFRYPVKATLIVTLPLALLAAAGLDEAARAPQRVRRLMIGATIVAAILVAGAYAMRWNDAFAGAFAQRVFEEMLPIPRRALLSQSFMHCAIAIEAVVAAIVLARTRRESIPGALAAVVAIDLAIAGYSVNVYAPRTIFDPPAAVKLVKSAVDDGRFYRGKDPLALAIGAPSNDVRWLINWRLATLSGYSAAMFGIPVIFEPDYDGLEPRAMLELTRLIDGVPWLRRVPLLRVAGVRTIIAFDDIRAAGVRLLARPRIRAGILSAYAVDGIREAFVSRVSVVDRTKTLAAVAAIPAAGGVVLTAPAPAPPRDCGAAPVRVLARSAEHAEYAVAAPCAGYLYLAEPDFPGWHAFVDGHEVPIVRANHAFSAVPVGPGQHRVRRSYEPSLVGTGIVLSLLSLAALVALWVRFARRERAGGIASPVAG